MQHKEKLQNLLWNIYNIEGKDDAMVHSYTIFQIREAVGRSQMFFKVEVLKNFAGKHLCGSLFLMKLQGWKGLQYFPVKFAKNLRTLFSSEHLRWLLLRSTKFLISSAFLL